MARPGADRLYQCRGLPTQRRAWNFMVRSFAPSGSSYGSLIVARQMNRVWETA